MTSALPAIKREIVVDADPILAFDVFTDQIGAWWPVADLSVFGAEAAVRFESGQIVERAADGQQAVWGTVTRWEPGVAVAFTWHPGRASDRASQVTVTFIAAANSQTLVTLSHGGWEVFEDPAVARAEYEQGWPEVLDAYAARLGSVAEPTDDMAETWVALLHRPSATAPQGDAVFGDPRFGDHVAFLHRMHAAGFLVAAGPMADRPGEGMTVLRLPGDDELPEATRLATEDDASVAGGLFEVTVRPWQVMFASG